MKGSYSTVCLFGFRPARRIEWTRSYLELGFDLKIDRATKPGHEPRTDLITSHTKTLVIRKSRGEMTANRGCSGFRHGGKSFNFAMTPTLKLAVLQGSVGVIYHT
jgi:hypothetical protein